MKEFWTSIANTLSGDNGPLYVALYAITGLTLGWRFLDKSYQAEWKGGIICPAGSTSADSYTEFKHNSDHSSEVDNATDTPAE